MEAQHISLTQIHAAQLELLQEGTRSQELGNHTDQGKHMGECARVISQIVSLVVFTLLGLYKQKQLPNMATRF